MQPRRFELQAARGGEELPEREELASLNPLSEAQSAPPRWSRSRVVIPGVLATIAFVGAGIAGRFFHQGPDVGAFKIVGGETIGLSTQLQDEEGRCLIPGDFKVGGPLVLGDCKAGSTEQFFVVDKSTGIIKLGQQGFELCVTLAGYHNDLGRPLHFDICRPGYYLQRIVGMCLTGESKKTGTQAHVHECDSSVKWPRMGVSLFCFMAILPGSAEVALKDVAASRGTSIFACEEYRVYWSYVTHKYHTPSDGDFVANIDVFQNIWQSIWDEQAYKGHDWTIKVDADVVWIPQRLRERLWQLGTTINEAVYVKNTWQSFGFLGPLETLSQYAVVKMSQVAAEHCKYDPNGGEDGWIKTCLDLYAGVGWKEDTNLLNSRCNVNECGDGRYVAFHHYKSPERYNDCLDRMR